MLFANQAVLVTVPGDTARAVKIRQPHPRLLLGLQIQWENGARRTNLRTQCALVLAVAVAHVRPGRPESLQSRFQKRRLQTGACCGANAHTLVAADAAVQKVLLNQSTRRSDGGSSAAPVRETHAQRSSRCGTADQRFHKTPPRQVDGFFRLLPGKTDRVVNRVDGTDVCALLALDALARDRLPVPVFDRVHATPELAQPAVRARIGHHAAGHPKPSEDTKQSSQGTQISTPETALVAAKQDNPQENQKDEKAAAEVGHVHRQHSLLERVQERVHRIREPGDVCSGIEHGQERLRKPGVKGCRESPRNDRDGVEISCELDRKHAAKQDSAEKRVLPAAEAESFALANFFARPREQFVGEIEQCTQGANPAAEETAEGNREQQNDQANDGARDEGTRGNDGHYRSERTAAQEKIGRDSGFVGVAGLQKQVDEQRKEQELGDPPGGAHSSSLD